VRLAALARGHHIHEPRKPHGPCPGSRNSHGSTIESARRARATGSSSDSTCSVRWLLIKTRSSAWWGSTVDSRP
jgi:hypothetical protein